MALINLDPYGHSSVVHRYQNDVEFRQLVDLLRAQINQAKYTPTEIREAAMLAQILYEETTLRPILIDVVRRGDV